MSTVADYTNLIVNAANRHGVPPEIALAVAKQESGIRQYDSQGKVIARYEPHLNESSLGIFQLLESTARDLGVNPNDAAQNIDGGVRYLKTMYNMTGDWGAALQAYNGGIGNWQRGTVSTGAKSYSTQVLARAGMTQTPGGGGAPTINTRIGLPDTDFGGWWASLFGGGGNGSGAAGGDPVYNTGAVYTSDVVGDMGPNVALLLVLGLAAAVVISQV